MPPDPLDELQALQRIIWLSVSSYIRQNNGNTFLTITLRPQELTEANNLFLYTRICMPLSKPIISLIALQTFNERHELCQRPDTDRGQA